MEIKHTFFKKKKLELAVAALAVVVVVLGVCAAFGFTVPYAVASDGEHVEDPWVVTIGEEEAFVVASQEEGNAIIEEVKASYSTENTQESKTTLEPEVKVVEKELKRSEENPVITETDDAVAAVLEANATEDPMVIVRTTEKVTKEEKIDYEIEYEESDELYVGEEKVVEKGEKGVRTVVRKITKENGKVIAKKIISKTVEEEPKTEVVQKGTKTLTGGAVMGNGSGQDVANYALQFVGNPYKYGGSSLTNGTDCSGFTMSVYAHFGISLPHSSSAQLSCGKGVPYSEAKPGDIICYSGHVAIYIGNGKIVHASTASTGIIVSNANYRKILSVRRIIE